MSDIIELFSPLHELPVGAKFSMDHGPVREVVEETGVGVRCFDCDETLCKQMACTPSERKDLKYVFFRAVKEMK